MLPGACHTKDEAVKRAQALRERMKKPAQWAIKVHSNDGWHYRLLGPCGVSINVWENDTYFCMISYPNEPAGGGATLWSDPEHRHFKDPQKAFEFMGKRAATVCDTYTEHARKLRELV